MIGSQAQVSPADLLVPTADSAVNLTLRDVIGNKTDTYDGNSLYGTLQAISDSIENERRVYPTLANGATVISANTDWIQGAYATVIPASTIATDIHIIGVSIEACNRDAVFELELYKGDGDDVITAVRFAIEGGFFGNQNYYFGSEHIDANERIRARLASSNGTAQIATIEISVSYWPHA